MSDEPFEGEAKIRSGVPDNDEMWEKQQGANFLGVSLWVFNALIAKGEIKVYRYSPTTHRVRAAEVREFRERSAHVSDG